MRRVESAREFVRAQYFFGNRAEVLYTCKFSDYSVCVETSASCDVVAKILHITDPGAISIAVYRWFSEIYMHTMVEKRFPSETLELVDSFFDDSLTFVIIYERARSIPRSVYESRISEMVDMVVKMNKEGFVHLDTKPSNFLMRADGAIVLHDWGLAASIGHEDEIPFDLMRAVDGDDGELAEFWSDFTSNSLLLIRAQTRLMFTGFGGVVPHGVDVDVVGLPAHTMYHDEHFRVLEKYMNASQPLYFDKMFDDVVAGKNETGL